MYSRKRAIDKNKNDMNDYNIDEEINKVDFPIGKIISVTFLVFFIIYILYHLYNGNYGLKSYINKQNIINQKNIDYEKIEKEINSMKNKIEKLQGNNLDSDLLDEEIRKNTGYAKKNEMVLYSDDLE